MWFNGSIDHPEMFKALPGIKQLDLHARLVLPCIVLWRVVLETVVEWYHAKTDNFTYIWNEPVQKWYIQQLHNQFWQKTTLLTKYGINANFKTATKAWLLTDTIVTHLDNFFIEQLKRKTVLFNVVKLWFPDLKQCQEKEHEYVYEKGECMSA